MTTYVTEQCRFLDEPFKGMPKQLSSIRATISDVPENTNAGQKHFSPDEWSKLLGQDDVMYRYKSGPYSKPV